MVSRLLIMTSQHFVQLYKMYLMKYNKYLRSVKIVIRPVGQYLGIYSIIYEAIHKYRNPEGT